MTNTHPQREKNLLKIMQNTEELPPTLILQILMPGVTVEPSSTSSSSITPAAGACTGTEVYIK